LSKFSNIAKKIGQSDAVKPDLVLMDIILKGLDEEMRERTKVTEPFCDDKRKCT
jgi:hypothetical protein